MLSSFNSYFKKVIKVQHPRSASSGSRTAPAAAATTDHSEEEQRNRNHSKMRKILDDHQAATHDNPLNHYDNNNHHTPNIQNNSFMSHLYSKKSSKHDRDHASRRSKSNTNFFKHDTINNSPGGDMSQSLMLDTYENGQAPVPVSEVRFNKNTS